jgi:hypothetical protein
MPDNPPPPDNGAKQGEDVASSTRYMPQAGKSAGKYEPQTDKPDQGTNNQDKDVHREHVAGSTPHYPQAGKPAGKSAL